MMKDFTRQEFIDIRMRAMDMADVYAAPNWQLAFTRLAEAADALDAMMCRKKLTEEAQCLGAGGPI